MGKEMIATVVFLYLAAGVATLIGVRYAWGPAPSAGTAAVAVLAWPLVFACIAHDALVGRESYHEVEAARVYRILKDARADADHWRERATRAEARLARVAAAVNENEESE